MPLHVNHIADVSFKDHFLETGSSTPKNGLIEVNDNTFEVSFDNGRVNARFTTGNWFTNLFRFKTMGRFKERLQTQYDSWVQEKQLSASQAGFKDNSNVPAVKTALDECFGLLHDNASKLDQTTLNCSKNALKAYGTMQIENGKIILSQEQEQELDEHDIEHFEHWCEVMPKKLGEYAKRLGNIANLAAVRNELTTVATGSEICAILLERYGLKAHPDINCAGKSEAYIKKYMLEIVDSLLDGFLTAFNAMKDKNVELFRFLERFDGVCIEAKNDNIQDWFIKASDSIKEARSKETDNLAFCATAEFNALADEVKAPFREEARKDCEAEVREECKKAGIVDEETIAQRIDERVEVLMLKRSAEIDPLVHAKIESDGKFALYDNLAGANRPVTFISKNEQTGIWKVTTLVDKDNKPVLKPVSAFDIDKQFAQLAAMYKDEAVAMGMVEYETCQVQVKMGNRNDLFAADVTAAASSVLKDDEKVKTLCQRAKNQMRVKLDITDAEFEETVREALADVAGLKGNDAAAIELNFSRFVNNYGDASYADQRSDTGRLANLVARRVETRKAYYDSFLADLDGKASRCAQMMKTAFVTKHKVVDVKAAKNAIESTLRTMIERVKADPNGQKNQSCKKNLFAIMHNGRIFSDMLDYDISRRAAGGKESKLHTSLNTLIKCIEHYGKIPRDTFVQDEQQEAVA